ncbi:hypothetical protein ACIGFK_11655 [Streptomyces sp. NPDC085524]|uniref:hypothetical protein n=1 Tax=unclassified Streptomyces TaxID=2593676 RepID=UPI0035DFBD73
MLAVVFSVVAVYGAVVAFNGDAGSVQAATVTGASAEPTGKTDLGWNTAPADLGWNTAPADLGWNTAPAKVS